MISWDPHTIALGVVIIEENIDKIDKWVQRVLSPVDGGSNYKKKEDEKNSIINYCFSRNCLF